MATRQQFVQTAVSYLGAVRGSAKHRRLIDIFNQHKPDGWPMNYVAPWCAASVSAWAYELGIGNLIPVRFLKLSRWAYGSKAIHTLRVPET